MAKNRLITGLTRWCVPPVGLAAASAALVFCLTGCATSRDNNSSHAPNPNVAAHETNVELAPDTALARLVEGNRRFASGQAIHPDQSVERRAALAGGQSPFAVVLTCSDSRVAPELYFDQGLGDLFVLRNAGNILDDHTLGSIEYAVEHLHVRLIVVVGHEKCGAVSAALGGKPEPGHIQSILDSIAPALGGVNDQPGDKLDTAVRANARRTSELLGRTGPILEEAVKAGRLRVVAAKYDLAGGTVEILP